MPTYEFGCIDCGEKFEIFATVSQKESGLDLTCPKCGGMKVAQLFNSINFVKSNAGSADKAFQMSGGCGPNAGPNCCG